MKLGTKKMMKDATRKRKKVKGHNQSPSRSKKMKEVRKLMRKSHRR